MAEAKGFGHGFNGISRSEGMKEPQSLCHVSFGWLLCYFRHHQGHHKDASQAPNRKMLGALHVKKMLSTCMRICVFRSLVVE